MGDANIFFVESGDRRGIASPHSKRWHLRLFQALEVFADPWRIVRKNELAGRQSAAGIEHFSNHEMFFFIRQVEMGSSKRSPSTDAATRRIYNAVAAADGRVAAKKVSNPWK